MASAEESTLGSGTFDDAARKWGLVNEVRRMLRTYEMPSDPVFWYQRTKAKFNASDAEIVDALLGQIFQDGVPDGKKDGVVARRAADIGLNLFRGDQELEKVVLDACLNPSRFNTHGRELGLSPVIPAVVRFALLRGDTPGEYISHSTWESRDAFMAWTQSPAFAAGHRGGSLMGIIDGPPRVALYDAVIDTEFAKATA